MKGEVVMANIRPGIEIPIIPEDFIPLEEELFPDKTDAPQKQNLMDEITQVECDYSAA
jgi:hypothetical protein